MGSSALVSLFPWFWRPHPGANEQESQIMNKHTVDRRGKGFLVVVVFSPRIEQDEQSSAASLASSLQNIIKKLCTLPPDV